MALAQVCQAQPHSFGFSFADLQREMALVQEEMSELELRTTAQGQKLSKIEKEQREMLERANLLPKSRVKKAEVSNAFAERELSTVDTGQLTTALTQMLSRIDSKAQALKGAEELSAIKTKMDNTSKKISGIAQEISQGQDKIQKDLLEVAQKAEETRQQLEASREARKNKASSSQFTKSKFELVVQVTSLLISKVIEVSLLILSRLVNFFKGLYTEGVKDSLSTYAWTLIQNPAGLLVIGWVAFEAMKRAVGMI